MIYQPGGPGSHFPIRSTRQRAVACAGWSLHRPPCQTNLRGDRKSRRGNTNLSGYRGTLEALITWWPDSLGAAQLVSTRSALPVFPKGPAPQRARRPFSLKYWSTMYQGQSGPARQVRKHSFTVWSSMLRKCSRLFQGWYCTSAQRAPNAKSGPSVSFTVGDMITIGIVSFWCHSRCGCFPPRKRTKRKKLKALAAAT